ncbi:MAG: nucleotidyltransferase domain-containing protein [Chitinophagaceae bacterium]
MMFGLNEKTINKINSVFIKYPEIEEVFIYGSRAKGNYKEGSDIDICLKGKNINETTCKRVSADLDDLNTPYFFDISTYHKISNSSLLTEISVNGQIFYQKEKNI